MCYIETINCIGEIATLRDVKYYDSELNILRIVNEARYLYKRKLEDGAVHDCHFKTFNKHKDRPGLIIHNDAIGRPLVMALGSTIHDNEWEKYPENLFIDDWKYAGLKNPTYANTFGIYELKDVNVYDKYGKLTPHDYSRIVKPTVERIVSEDLDKLFESYNPSGFDNFFD